MRGKSKYSTRQTSYDNTIINLWQKYVGFIDCQCSDPFERSAQIVINTFNSVQNQSKMTMYIKSNKKVFFIITLAIHKRTFLGGYFIISILISFFFLVFTFIPSNSFPLYFFWSFSFIIIFFFCTFSQLNARTTLTTDRQILREIQHTV